MKNTIRFFLFFVFLITGMYNCTLDYDRNLGNGYFLTGYGVTTVIYKKVDSKEDDIVLLGEIVECKSDENFIVIYREITKKVKEFCNDHYVSEIMRGGDTIQYWIINKKKNTIIGPLHKEVFIWEFKKLNISNSIQLERVSKYIWRQ